ETRRGLGEVLLAGHVEDRERVALLERRELALLLLLGVVAALGVDAREAIEDRATRRGPQPVASRLDVHARGLDALVGHLAGQGALPDQPVEARLVPPEVPGERLRVADERGRADGLVGLLRAARLGAVGAPARQHVRVP